MLAAGQTDWYQFSVFDAERLTAALVPTLGGTFAPRLALYGPSGTELIQSDNGSIVQHLEGGTYELSVAARSGAGNYQLLTELVQASAPNATSLLSNPKLNVNDGIVNAVAIADFNGDGVPDLVVANYASSTDGSVNVLLGNGDGTFQPEPAISVGPRPVYVAVADLTGDGKQDIVVASERYGSGTVSVLMGNGDGTFQPENTIFIGPNPISLAVADLNGDGEPDIVVANRTEPAGSPYGYADNTIGVLMGNGDGTFQPEKTFSVGNSPGALAVAELTGDGVPDIVAANSGSDTVSVLMGNGDGTFQTSRTITLGSRPSAIAVADLNGDEKPDLVAAYSGEYGNGNTVSVLLGNGDGTFQPPRTLGVGAGPDAIAVADLNGDGKRDLVVANSSDNTVSVLLGNGDGTFRAQVATDTGPNPTSLSIADLNGDSRPDLIVAGTSVEIAQVALGNGDGTFESQQTVVSGPTARASAGAVGDLTGNGRQDIVTLNDLTENDTSISVHLGNGDGTFQPARAFDLATGSAGINGHGAVAIADLNGDGRPDLVVTNSVDETIDVLLGNGDGTFRALEPIPVGAEPYSIAIADLNGDGKQDLVVANFSTGTVGVFFGNGDGTFQPERTFDLGPYSLPESVAVVDLNGDGKADIIVGALNTQNGGDASVSVLMGNGDGTFQPARKLLDFGSNSDLVALAVADLNGDGKPDIAVVNQYNNFYYGDHSSGAVRVLLGNGDGTFEDEPAMAIENGPVALAVADLNGDGKPDIVVANSVDNTATVLMGNGDGTFQPGRTIALGQKPGFVAIADFNGDGIPDLVVANQYSSTVTALLGNGDGTFAPVVPTNAAELHNTPNLANLTGHRDGTLDSVVLDSSGNILFREGLGNDRFASPVVLNTGQPARDITVIQTATGWAVSAASASFDPALSSANNFVYTVSLYTVNGDDSPNSPTVAFQTPFDPTQIAAADLTGDGLDDIVVADSQGDNVQVALHNSEGTFAAPLTIPVGVAPSDLALVDVNGDGRKDVVVTDQGGGNVAVLLNQGNGTFSGPYCFRAGVLLDTDTETLTGGGTALSSLEESVGLVGGDFTDDGPEDLVVVNRGADAFSVLQNDGNGGFLDPTPSLTFSTSGDAIANDPSTFTTNEQAGPIVSGDFNNDGKPDLAILMENSDEVWIYTNEGGGIFQHTFTVEAGAAPTGLSKFEDPTTHLLDLAAGDAFGDVLILQGKGDGTFTPVVDTKQALAVGDLFHNGQEEAVLSDPTLNLVSVQVAGADGEFQPLAGSALKANFSLPGAVQVATIGGVNYIVVANGGGNDVLVFRQIDGQFAPIQDIPVGTDPVSLALVPNPSGIATDPPYLMVSNQGSNDVDVLVGTISSGNWTLTPGPRIKSGGTGPIDARTLMLPVDSIASLVTTDAQSGAITVSPGVGQGFFDDQSTGMRVLNLPGNPTLAQAPVFFPNNTGVALTTSGQLIQFNLNNFTSSVLPFFPAQPIRAVFGTSNGGLVFAEQGGAVEMAGPDFASGAINDIVPLEALDGLPTDPSAMAELDNGDILVTNQGSDTIYQFAAGPFEPPPAISLPPQTAEDTLVETTTPGDASLVVIVELAAGILTGSETMGEVAILTNQAMPGDGFPDVPGSSQDPDAPGSIPDLTPQQQVPDPVTPFLEGSLADPFSRTNLIADAFWDALGDGRRASDAQRSGGAGNSSGTLLRRGELVGVAPISPLMAERGSAPTRHVNDALLERAGLRAASIARPERSPVVGQLSNDHQSAGQHNAPPRQSAGAAPSPQVGDFVAPASPLSDGSAVAGGDDPKQRFAASPSATREEALLLALASGQLQPWALAWPDADDEPETDGFR